MRYRLMSTAVLILLCLSAAISAQTRPATRLGTQPDTALVKLFDLKPGEDENPPADKAKLMAEFAPITHVKADSPPAYLSYGGDRSIPAANDLGASIHHPRFGDVLNEKLDGLKVECIVKVKGEPMQDPTPIEFLKKHLKVE